MPSEPKPSRARALLVPLATFAVMIAAGIALGRALTKKPEAPAPAAADAVPTASPLSTPAPPAVGMPELAMPAAVPLTPGPQPPGPVPEGKVWSPEHGHWHDAPGSTPQTVTFDQNSPTATPGDPSSGITMTPQPMAAPGTLTPQPPGPAPEGKVWSPEHGHWHDAPAVTPP